MDLTFEQALVKLESVIEAMESDKTTLEESITLYKEGAKLSEHCDKILSRFEAEVVVLQKNMLQKEDIIHERGHHP